MKKIADYFNLKISEKALKEANDNRFRRLKFSKKNEHSKNLEDQIEEKIAYFRKCIEYNGEISRDFGSDFFAKVKDISQYEKENGEFFSVALSLYLSRSNLSQVTFYTDDKPAEEYFSSFFRKQQIGKIEDSVDLLVFLYWLYPNFCKRDLESFLSELHSQYATRVKELLSIIRNYKDNNSSIKIKKIKNTLDKLDSKLEKLDFRGIKELKEDIHKNKRQHMELCNKLDEYNNVFELETEEKQNTLTKARKTLKYLKEKRIYKSDGKSVFLCGG
jgi:hypothetical protein